MYIVRKTGVSVSSHYKVKLWNNLPASLRTSSSLSSFKSKVNTYLFQDVFLFLYALYFVWILQIE